MGATLREARHPLVVFGNGYGDHLINLPALRGLAAGFEGRLSLIAFPRAGERFFSDLELKQVLEVEFRKLGKQPRRTWPDLELPECDLLISLNPWTSPWMEWLLETLDPRQSVGFFPMFQHVLPLDFSKYSGDLAFDITRTIFPELQFDAFAHPPALPHTATAKARRIRRRVPDSAMVLTVHADTGAEKRWAAERFGRALDRFLGRHPEVVCFVVGQADTGLTEIAHGQRVFSLLGEEMSMSMAWVGQSDLFLGIDSCFLHAADFFRIPSVGLFGPTDTTEFGFRLPGIWRHVEGGGSMEGVTVDAVLDALESVRRRALDEGRDVLRLRRLEQQPTYSIVRDGRRCHWSVPRLWQESAELPRQTMSVEEFDLDRSMWLMDGEAPTVRWMAEHFQRLLRTEPRWPIILSASGEVMDGWHRLAWAWARGEREIQAVRFPRDPVPDVVIDAGG